MLKIKKGKLGEPAFKKGDGVYILKDLETMIFSVIVIENGELKYGNMRNVFDVLEECIRLLSVDGSNTKQQVKEMLERLVDNE